MGTTTHLPPIILNSHRKLYLATIIQRYPHFDDLGWDSEVIEPGVLIDAYTPEEAMEAARQLYAPAHVDPALISVVVSEEG